MYKKLYADRDTCAQGDNYIKHISAMTSEDLRNKSDIAAELAHRDIIIERQQAEIERLNARVKELETLVADADMLRTKSQEYTKHE